MPRRTYNFFSKLIHFFKRCFSPSRSISSSSNVDVALAEPPHITPPHYPIRPSSPLPQRSPSPALLAPSSSEVKIPPSLTTVTLQPPPSVGCEALASHITASSLIHDVPPSPSRQITPQARTPHPTPHSPQPPASHARTPQLGEPTGFAGAHDFVIKDSQFIDVSLAGSGLKELLKHSMPDTFHNSAARYPPPKCHFHTRKDYINKITEWALRKSDHHEPILWMHGPFGIGKSAVAQSCAEALQLQNKLAATLFFSRSNTGRDDPRRVFTSIAYQVAIMCPPFRDTVDALVHNDPSFSTKSLSTQFEELLVHPLRQIDIVRNGIGGRVVVIDGLDECRGTPAQCDIIEIIATSVRNQTTPFLWFITSRPEEHITRTMNSDNVLPVSFHLELPVSREIDHEILTYLTDEFEKIRKRHRLPESWPSEETLALLVDRASGLWIYVTSMARFIAAEDSFGPEDQLRIVLEFAKSMSAKAGEDNPLAEMDLFYILIMNQVPQKIRTTLRKILLTYSVTDWPPRYVAGAVGLSVEQFRRSCASIQSVMEIRGSSLDEMIMHFYHASFLDFMKDYVRSKDLCIYGDFLIDYRRERLGWLHHVCSRSTGPSKIVFPSEPVLLPAWDYEKYYSNILFCFFRLCCVPDHPFDLETAVSLEKLRFQMMLRLTGYYGKTVRLGSLEHFRNNLPTELRDKIIRLGRCPTIGCANTKSVWIFGHGENETVAEYESHGGGLWLKDNQDPKPGRCFCGSRIQKG